MGAQLGSEKERNAERERAKRTISHGVFIIADDDVWRPRWWLCTLRNRTGSAACFFLSVVPFYAARVRAQQLHIMKARRIAIRLSPPPPNQ